MGSIPKADEGWWHDDYVTLFRNVAEATERYGVSEYFPGCKVLGLLSWEDFILEEASGRIVRAPCVPCTPSYAEHLDSVPDSSALESDKRFTGRVRWRVKPLVFGGDPEDEANISEVDFEQHAKLVQWWNGMYRKAGGS